MSVATLVVPRQHRVGQRLLLPMAETFAFPLLVTVDHERYTVDRAAYDAGTYIPAKHSRQVLAERLPDIQHVTTTPTTSPPLPARTLPHIKGDGGMAMSMDWGQMEQAVLGLLQAVAEVPLLPAGPVTQNHYAAAFSAEARALTAVLVMPHVRGIWPAVSGARQYLAARTNGRVAPTAHIENLFGTAAPRQSVWPRWVEAESRLVGGDGELQSDDARVLNLLGLTGPAARIHQHVQQLTAAVARMTASATALAQSETGRHHDQVLRARAWGAAVARLVEDMLAADGWAGVALLCARLGSGRPLLSPIPTLQAMVEQHHQHQLQTTTTSSSTLARTRMNIPPAQVVVHPRLPPCMRAVFDHARATAHLFQKDRRTVASWLVTTSPDADVEDIVVAALGGDASQITSARRAEMRGIVKKAREKRQAKGAEWQSWGCGGIISNTRAGDTTVAAQCPYASPGAKVGECQRACAAAAASDGRRSAPSRPYIQHPLDYLW